jgi:hypothetical protein
MALAGINLPNFMPVKLVNTSTDDKTMASGKDIFSVMQAYSSILVLLPGGPLGGSGFLRVFRHGLPYHCASIIPEHFPLMATTLLAHTWRLQKTCATWSRDAEHGGSQLCSIALRRLVVGFMRLMSAT